jgi:CubicO group peptidase (beta-lactamase class C family)
LWYQSGFADQEICCIGIHGQWLWINPQKELVIVKLASHDSEVDTATDRVMLAAFRAIAEALN